MARITALRGSGTRVTVELDGVCWRTVPGAAVVAAGLAVGVVLDRERARALARALRRLRAEDAALRALARRDHSRSSLETRLTRSNVAPEERRAVLARVARSGLVDDVRFAEQRARRLAERGAGDLLVLDDLARHGIEEPVARGALAVLEPEPVRAARILRERGMGPRTLRHLASRGFSEETLEPLIADFESRALR